MSKPTRKTAAAKPTMSAEQNAYAVALAAYEHASETAESLIKSSPELAHGADETEETREAIEAARDHVRESLRVYDLSDAKVAAERAMVLWSCGVAKRLDPSKAAEIDDTAAKAYLKPAFWRRMVDIAFRLAA